MKQGDGNQIKALGGDANFTPAQDVDIFNQSYGSSRRGDATLDGDIANTLKYGVKSLRKGKGAIYIKSAGNGFEHLQGANCTAGFSCQNSNMDPIHTVPFQMVVGATNANGVKSSYSTAGASVWISSPGGEDGTDNPAMITTDQSGCHQGYSTSTYSSRHTISRDLDLNCNYTKGFNGTSSAAPTLAGAVALLLEANPDLTWRDVKHILAKTADKIDADRSDKVVILQDGNYIAEPKWTINQADYHFHNWYGFGQVNVDKAVAMASDDYKLLPEFKEGEWVDSATLSLTIPDHSAKGASATLNVSDELIIEAVVIKVSIEGVDMGDIGIELQSPQGTRSVLFNIHNGFKLSDRAIDQMRLLSNAFYGESASGQWTLKVVDAMPTDQGKLTKWSIKIDGHVPSE